MKQSVHSDELVSSGVYLTFHTKVYKIHKQLINYFVICVKQVHFKAKIYWIQYGIQKHTKRHFIRKKEIHKMYISMCLCFLQKNGGINHYYKTWHDEKQSPHDFCNQKKVNELRNQILSEVFKFSVAAILVGDIVQELFLS